MKFLIPINSITEIKESIFNIMKQVLIGLDNKEELNPSQIIILIN